MFLVAMLVFFSHWTAVMVEPYPAFVADRAAAQKTAVRRQLQEAAWALQTYLLFRTGSNLNIAHGTTATYPRLLMLPCPDNIGDGNLDGGQDPHCAAKIRGNNRVNGILGGGSRFGRLPNRSRLQPHPPNTLNDGLRRHFFDSRGNRFWYALSRNMAPNRDRTDNDIESDSESAYTLLNFHSLVTKADDWLTAVDQNGNVLSDKSIAVVLSPNATRGGRFSEEHLRRAGLDHSRDVLATDGGLRPDKFFEKWTVDAGGGNERVYNNADYDGVFVAAAARPPFDDSIVHIDLNRLIRPDGVFYHAYKKIVGIAPVHNRPLVGTPLAMTHAAMADYAATHNVFPVPAANSALNLGRMERYCADYRTPPSVLTLSAAAGTTLVAATSVTVSSANGITATLNSAAVWKLHSAMHTPAAVSNAVINDMTVTAAIAVTLFASTTINLSAAVLHISGATPAGADTFVLPLSATAVLSADAVFTVPPQTPLQPGGSLKGWLPSLSATVSALPDHPPCFAPEQFDTRRQFNFFVRDQPIFYAVAEGCYIGGDCAGGGGLTVSVAAQTPVALPEAYTLTQTFTADIGGGPLTLQNGIIRTTADITLQQPQWLPIKNGAVTVAQAQLNRGFVLADGQPLVLPPSTPLRGENDFVFTGVPALLIYSPAPLLRVACPHPQISNQTGEVTGASELTDYCYWLDTAENADSDNIYDIQMPQERHSDTLINDYFLFFGGTPVFS